MTEIERREKKYKEAEVKFAAAYDASVAACRVVNKAKLNLQYARRVAWYARKRWDAAREALEKSEEEQAK